MIPYRPSFMNITQHTCIHTYIVSGYNFHEIDITHVHYTGHTIAYKLENPFTLVGNLENF